LTTRTLDPVLDPALDLVDAGVFSTWFDGAVAALRDGRTSDVPCGSCTGCCTSSQFVHVEPDELDALAHIPAALQFAAPGRPAGHVVLGYDEQGRCPMLVEGACSIYEHRPRACRAYDCRVFAATGVAPDPSQPGIADRVERWRFHVDDAARWDALHAAVPADGSPLARALRALQAVAP
jgi:hypothetical protein